MTDTVDLAAFQTDVRGWIEANLTDELREAGRKSTSVFTPRPWNMKWQAILNTRGWVAPYWPVEYGGTGWSEAQRYIFASECARAEAPSLSPMGLRMVAPCIMKFGTEAQKAYYLPRLLAGEDYWCQGYSEPQAGSDLASLSLRADKDGADYILNGSKIWTTHAHFANRMFLLVRTNRDGRPQTGITFLLMDMDTPGVEVRPIVSIAGDHDFNQVFFDNVRVPQANRVGEEDMGWTVAKYLLEFERASAFAAPLKVALDRVRDAAASASLAQDAMIRRKIALIAGQIAAIEVSEQQVMAAVAKGKNPGAISSMLKVQGTETAQAIQHLLVEIAGDYAAVYQENAREPGSNAEIVGPEAVLCATASYFNGRAASIYGGSNEIQRNIMAKFMLGF